MNMPSATPLECLLPWKQLGTGSSISGGVRRCDSAEVVLTWLRTQHCKRTMVRIHSSLVEGDVLWVALSSSRTTVVHDRNIHHGSAVFVEPAMRHPVASPFCHAPRSGSLAEG